MRRHTIEPRPDWQQTVEAQGLIYPLTRLPDGTLRPYWDESAYYVFSLPEVEALEEVVEELHGMCLAAAEHIVTENRFAELGITDPRIAAAVTEAWHRRSELPSLYGRFDLRYDGTGPAKLLEYNADTPTSLVEAASAQWFWMEDRFPGADQWNSLHERLVDAWRKQAGLLPPGSPLHFAHSAADELGEDLMTVAYLKETAEQAGLDTDWISMEEIGWDALSGRFVDNQLRFIRSCFKLYPWEWLTTDEFADQVLDTLDNGGGTGSTLWIEPAWKMLLSNKALLAILWELYPDHANLLPAYLDGPRDLTHTTGYVRKPLLGREGAGVTIHKPPPAPAAPTAPAAGPTVPTGPAAPTGHAAGATVPTGLAVPTAPAAGPTVPTGPAVPTVPTAPTAPAAHVASGMRAAPAAPAAAVAPTTSRVPSASALQDPCCYQQLAALPTFDGNHVVLGAWVVAGESAGLGIRESDGPITDEYARFLPHVIL